MIFCKKQGKSDDFPCFLSIFSPFETYICGIENRYQKSHPHTVTIPLGSNGLSACRIIMVFPSVFTKRAYLTIGGHWIIQTLLRNSYSEIPAFRDTVLLPSPLLIPKHSYYIIKLQGLEVFWREMHFYGVKRIF